MPLAMDEAAELGATKELRRTNALPEVGLPSRP
jgi:hypothetical protein